MGFDIYGRKPTNELNIVKPNMDWTNEPSEADRDAYFDTVRAYEEAVPGDYFRNNVWWWRPLWDFICENCDDILDSEDMYGGEENSGKVIFKYKALKIAKRLQGLIDSGSVAEFEKQYHTSLDDLPLETCGYCDGTGIRTWPGKTQTLTVAGTKTKSVTKDCNVCNTEHTRKKGIPVGKTKQWQCSYPFSEKNVIEFTKFCKESGGFEIW